MVGIGFGQSAHVPAFQAQSGCVVHAIAASTVERARRIADGLGIPHAYGGWRELVAAIEIDAVSIAVPPILQPEIAAAAARSGKHVFCEKPVATNGRAAEALVRTVLEAGVRHAVDFEFPELAEWREATRLLNAGEIGDLREVSITWLLSAAGRGGRRAPWKRRDDQGGGAIGGFVSHALYHAELFLGPVHEVAAVIESAADGASERCEIVLAGAVGRRAELRIDVASAGASIHRLELVGSRERLSLENRTRDHAGPFELRLGRRVVSEGNAATFGVDRRAEAVSRVASRFLQAVRSGAAMHPDLRDGARVQRLLDAVLDSSRRGLATVEV